MPVSALTPVAQDYLKVIWTATEWSPTPITVKALAARLDVRPASVSEGLRRLADQGLVVHERYGAIQLTDAGRQHAVAMVRRHRLLETFLVEMLGYGWDEVHEEAEILEHAVSDLLLDRVDAALGHPGRDPHGDPIPAADGTSRAPETVPLADASAGEHRIARISDADPEVLRSLAERGVGLDTVVRVAGTAAGASAVVPAADGALRLTDEEIAAVRVLPAAATRR
jgi:DtxR family Mn-dependent transcriptional regulator